MSALKKRPGFQLAEGRDALMAQQQRIQNRIDKMGPNAPGKYAKRLSKVQSALNSAPPDITTSPIEQPTEFPGMQQSEPTYNMDMVSQRANNAMGAGFNSIQDVYQNNPLQQDYSAMRQQATDTAMSEFDRMNAPEYQRQDTAFRDEMAQRGIQVGSKAYEDAYTRRIADPRANARQGAMNNAFQMGQGEQAQMFNQGVAKSQLPFQQLSYMSPFYNAQMQQQMQQGQQGWLAGQNQLDRDQQMALQKLQGKQQLQAIHATPHGGGGGGGLSYDQQLGLLDRSFYNNMVLNGMNGGAGGMPQQGYGSGFMQGAGAGIGAGLASALVK